MPQPTPPDRPPLATLLVAAMAGGTFLLHLIVNLATPYGIHRDEFLYFAMGDHLRLWHMDFPPAIAMLSVVSRFVFGDSLAALRLVPSLGGGRAGRARRAPRPRDGGRALRPGLRRPRRGRRPSSSSARAACSSPSSSTRCGGRWASTRWCACAAATRRRPAGGCCSALAGGIGLLTKFSILFFGFGVLVALLATSWRSALLTRWPWLALLIALAIGSPSVVGQIALGWPLVGQMQDLQRSQLEHVTVAGFFITQLMFGPAMLVGAGGAIALLLGPRLRRFRLVGWTVLVVWITLVVLHGKAYYVGATYPILFAAGGVALEAWRRRALGAWVAWGAVGLTAAYGLLVLPLGLPILAPGPTERYIRAIGAVQALRDNQGMPLRLPQDYADMLGWRERVDAVAQAYRALSPLERARAVIIGNNYGEAGALEFYGPKLGLPPVVSAAGSFWYWGPGDRPGTVAVTLGEAREGLYRLYDSVEAGPHLVNPLTVMEEQDLTIYVCRKPKATLQAIWAREAGRH